MFLPRLTLRSRFDKLLNGHGDRHVHRRKRCAKKKCKERSEWSYVRGSSANLDVSPFCASHACQWREATGISCRLSKKSSKLYCKSHLACQAAPYGRQCSLERSNPLNRDAKFCELHACTWGGCNNETLTAQGRKAFIYCKDHNCQQADCGEARVGATGARQSVFCAAHTCKDDLCMANVHGAPEVGDAKGQHQYCPVHRPCRNADCDSMVHRVSNAEYRKHCSNHYCEFGSNCDEQRAPGVKVCGTHRCQRSGCAKGMQNAAGRYCEDHECKDAAAPCLEARVDHSEWCVSHICAEFRDKCKNQGCDNKILIDKGMRRQFCEDHFYGICEFIGCDKPRAWSNGHKHHCPKHACLAHPDCGSARTVSSSYCTRHKCSEPDCDTIRAPASSLSPSSLKQLAAASLVPGAGGLTIAGLSMYDPWCATHRCRDKGCAAQAVAAGGLCATHVCRDPECGARAEQDNGYCHQHCCRERGCLRAPVDVYHFYCDVHYHSDDDSSDDSDSAWSYASGGVGPNMSGLLAAPGWSGPFGLGGGGAGLQPPKRRKRRPRSRSGSRSRATTQQQKSRKSQKSQKSQKSKSKSKSRNSNANWNAVLGGGGSW
ncbi:hypothetical protein PG994_001199 [Apiospora phragmitis]|uniref:Uncharacterized protein n=1 Tax=Apiospora phragmitis TaxID=2905665 RepID=A0ABR1WSU8_9PEZI